MLNQYRYGEHNNLKHYTMNKEQILEIIQNNYNEFKGTNEAELQSAEDIVELFNKEVIKANIELLKQLDNEYENRLDFYIEDNERDNKFYNAAIKDVQFINNKLIEKLKPFSV